MELRHLRYFVAVAEALSFTKAAATLRLAQPSLTRQVRNLEAEIGVELFDRIHNRIALTDEGRRFLADAHKVLALCAESVAAVQEIKRGGNPQLNIGYVADIHDSLLPATLEAFRKQHPQVVLNLFDLTGVDQLQAIKDGQIDLGFIGLSPSIAVPGLLVECVTYELMVVALPALHPLRKKTEVQLVDLAAQFFIVMSARTHPGAREWLLETCRLTGFESRILQEADTESTAIKFVAGGLGVALLPEQSTLLPHDGVIFRPILPPLRRPSTIAWRSDNTSKALQAYVKIAKDLSHRRGLSTAKKLISTLPSTLPAVNLGSAIPRKRPADPQRPQ